jgi:hypothetical protein
MKSSSRLFGACLNSNSGNYVVGWDWGEGEKDKID